MLSVLRMIIQRVWYYIVDYLCWSNDNPEDVGLVDRLPPYDIKAK